MYKFGGFTLDVGERRLSSNGEYLAIAPKAFDLLVTLVRRAGRLISKQELLESVWPEAFVEEGILTVHVSALRKALCDTTRPARYIETVPRSGYRFVAPVTEQDSDRRPIPDRWSIAVLPARPLTGGTEGERLTGFAADAVTDAVATHLGATPNTAGSGADTAARSQRAGRSRPEVYELCGRGRLHLLSASMFEVPKAVDAFRAAVALDPSYAPAHSGLALAHCAQAAMRVSPPLDAYRDARAAALRALALDDGSADAQVALGTVLFFAEWHWEGAGRCLLRAIESNSSHVQGYVTYGRLLDALGRPQEALAMKIRALECDPLSPLVHVQIALCHLNQRRYDEAIGWANKALALDSHHLLAREFLAGAYLLKGELNRYVEEVIKHAASYGVPPENLEPLKAAYAAGAPAGARYSLEQVSRNARAPAYHLAVLSAQAGERDAAFLHLDRAILERDPSLVDLAVAPQWDGLRNDPRFEECVVRMALR